MANKNKLQEVLDDLYALDSSLRGREKELIPLIEKLIKAKPQTVFNETFAANLKKQLLSKTSEFGEKNNMKKEKTSLFNIDWKIMSYASVGTAALVLVAVLASSMAIYKQNTLVSNKKAPTVKNQIVKVSRNAFGTLALARNANQGNLEAMSKNSNASSPMNPVLAENAGVNPEVISARASIPMGAGGAPVDTKMMADSSIMMPPLNQGVVKYVYSGDDFELGTEAAVVYKKLPPSISSFEPVVSAVNGLNVDSLNLSSLKDLKLDSLSVKEDREFGYALTLSPSNNVFYMSKNWEKWPNPTAKCQDDQCWQDNRVKFSDMISDEEALSIAKNFVSEYRINIEGYGQPVIQNSWRASYESYSDKQNYYFPEEVYVVYPLMIEGAEVRGQGGELFGLMVGIDIRSHKAVGFNGTIAPSFESSEYDAITDKAEVIKLAEAGGFNGQYYFYAADSQTELTIELGTPKKVLIQNWKYDQQSGQGYELYLPAYVFPVKNKPENNFYVENIVVPLTKEAYENNNYPILMKGGAVSEPAVVVNSEISTPTPAVETEVVKPE